MQLDGLQRLELDAESNSIQVLRGETLLVFYDEQGVIDHFFEALGILSMVREKVLESVGSY